MSDVEYILRKELEEEVERMQTLYEEAVRANWALLFDEVVKWAEARNLIEGSTSQAQMVKLVEELGEVAHALARGDREKLKDGIGDALVVLTILASQNQLDIEQCLTAAYLEIKDRKGKMVNGVFVKEQDLE